MLSLISNVDLNLEIINQAPSMDLANPTWDLFIYLFFLIAVILFGFALGRQRVVSILISVYLSLTVVDALPYLDKILGETDINFGIFAFKFSSFIIIFVILFLVLSRSSILQDFGGPGRGGLIQVAIFSFLFIGLIVSIILSFLPTEALGYLSDFTKNLFISDLAKFIWIVAPIVAMGIFRGRREEAY